MLFVFEEVFSRTYVLLIVSPWYFTYFSVFCISCKLLMESYVVVDSFIKGAHNV